MTQIASLLLAVSFTINMVFTLHLEQAVHSYHQLLCIRNSEVLIMTSAGGDKMILLFLKKVKLAHLI